MDEELEKLKQQYHLSPEKVDEIAEWIVRNNTLGIVSVKNPHAIILGGQPGSGKGELITQAQDILGINAVTCNADDFRDQHPMHNEIKAKHEKYYTDLTADYSLVWNDKLRKHCEAKKFSYILETTFSSGDRMNDTILSIKSKGYIVSVMLLSVHHNLSFLGTRLRYEAMRAQSGYGRLVSKRQHDLRYDAIMDTLEHLRFFTSDILQLIKQMIWRDASNEELKEIFDVFDLDKVENLLAPESP